MNRYLLEIETALRRVGMKALFSLLLGLSGLAQGANPQLSAPARANGLFTFLLHGESKVGYVIERTVDLAEWVPVLTNQSELASSRVINLEAPDSRAFYRALRLPTSRFRFAIATSQIDLNGNNLLVDSFDSADPAASTDGRYDPLKRKAQADVAALAGLTGSFNAGNALIFGHFLTGSNRAPDLGPNGSIGDLDWIGAGQVGIQPGAWLRDFDMEFAPVAAPFSGSAYTPGPGMVNNEPYSFVLGDANYLLNSLSLNASARMIAVGHAVLYVTGNITISGSAYIEIATNSSLEIYCAGGSTSIGGNGILNRTGYATNFAYYGRSSNTNLSLRGNGDFIGTIYAPDAALRLNGSGNSPMNLSGAIVTKSVTVNGTLNFHYDETLLLLPATP